MTTPNSSSPLLPSALGNPSFLWRSGTILVAAGILTGAFGAHALRQRTGITTEHIQTWSRAATYAMVNGLGLMLVSMHPKFSAHRFAGPAILTGGLLFSGSIMGLILDKRLRFLGPMTPLGGMVMTAGYLSLAL